MSSQEHDWREGGERERELKRKSHMKSCQSTIIASVDELASLGPSAISYFDVNKR